MANNVNKEEINASDSSYAEEDNNEVEIFNVNGHWVNLNRNIRKVRGKYH